MPIAPHTWQELFDAVYEIHSATDHEDFAAAAVAGLCRLIPADVTTYQVLDRKTQRLMTRMVPPEPFTPEEIAYYTAHPDEFPIVHYYETTGHTQALRLSDLVDGDIWIKSRYYQKCLARQGLKYCLALPITVDRHTVVGLSFNRCNRDFSSTECEMLDAFAPHLRQAWARHEAPWAERGELAARRRLRALGLTPRESEVLYWMTEGKLNREVATILNLRLGTVQDYVASILLKLRQENRHAATVFAIHTISGK